MRRVLNSKCSLNTTKWNSPLDFWERGSFLYSTSASLCSSNVWFKYILFLTNQTVSSVFKSAKVTRGWQPRHLFSGSTALLGMKGQERAETKWNEMSLRAERPLQVPLARKLFTHPLHLPQWMAILDASNYLKSKLTGRCHDSVLKTKSYQLWIWPNAIYVNLVPKITQECTFTTPGWFWLIKKSCWQPRLGRETEAGPLGFPGKGLRKEWEEG